MTEKLVLTLIRTSLRDTCTLGTLYDNNMSPFLVTLEEPWKNNQRLISCIPEGVYNVSPYNGTRFKNVYHVEEVPNRSAILIHAGNTTDDVEGCILVGLSHGVQGGKPAVLKSRDAMQELREYIGSKNFKLVIKSA